MTIQNIVFVSSFLLSMPICFYVLLASRFDSCFKQGKTLEIRVAYVIVTIIVSFLLASALSALSSIFVIQ